MLENKPWWQYLNFTQQELVKQSFYLLNWAKKQKDKLIDYSFIVMPAAKAFEGFLKQLLFDLNLISQRKLEEKYFRIGKALNPELEHVEHLQKECLFKEISEQCGSETAELLWQAWKKCRNQLFHYFPKEKQTFSLKEAETRLNQLIEAIEITFKRCKSLVIK